MAAATEPPESDVVIIGAGAIGLSTAYYLLQRNVSVTIIDQGTLQDRCSFGNAGLVAPSHFIPLASPGVIAKGLKWMLNPESPFYIHPRLDLNLLKWLWKFRHFATMEYVVRHRGPLLEMLSLTLTLFQEMKTPDPASFEFRQHGLLMLIEQEQNRKELDLLYRTAQELNVPAKWLSQAEIRELDPNLQTNCSAGLYFPEDAHIEPGKFLREMSTYLQKQGVKIIENTPVHKIRREGSHITGVDTAAGFVPAKSIVLATGAWTPRLTRELGVDVPIQPAKGYSLTLPAPENLFHTPLILTETKVAVTPFQETLRFAGTLEFAGINLSINPRRVEAIRKAARRYLKNIPEDALQQATVWAGLRPCTPDGLPILGRIPEHPNVIIAAGHAMLGISLSTGSGLLAAQLVTEETPAINLEPFRVTRFK